MAFCGKVKTFFGENMKNEENVRAKHQSTCFALPEISTKGCELWNCVKTRSCGKLLHRRENVVNKRLSILLHTLFYLKGKGVESLFNFR